MSASTVTVTFLPSNKRSVVQAGTTLLEAAHEASVSVSAPCGGHGTCGKCRVRVASGTGAISQAERDALTETELAAGVRLACATAATYDTTVSLDVHAAGEVNHRILEDDGLRREAIGEQTIVRRRIELKAPTREHPASDIERVCEALECDRFAPHALTTVATALFGHVGEVDVALRGQTVIDVAVKPLPPFLGLAFDIGTTTVVGALVDLETGRQLGAAGRINPQTKRGDDVLSRIRICREYPHGLDQLAGAIRGALNEIVNELCAESGCARESIYEVTVAGNTAMQQIFARLNPAALGEVPFTPVFKRPLSVPSAWAGVTLHPEAELHIFPQLGGFVGGDTVAGILAVDIDRRDGIFLLVDVGTNGEIVLANRGALTATSVAAGPAFEGARIRHGMRGARGAIDTAAIDEDLRFTTIDHAPPAGICGSGLVDLAAAFLKAGIIDETGRVLPPDEHSAAPPPSLCSRLLRRDDGQVDILLVPAAESGRGTDILLHQRDVRELQLASGAIRAGIDILLKHAGIEAEHIDTLYLAGAFGNYIDKHSALRIGMLPPIDPARIISAGNTALQGARKYLLCLAERRRIWNLFRRVRHVDLSTDPDFQMEFARAMMFPRA